MSQTNQGPALRTRRKTATGTEVLDRKRKNRSSTTEEESRSKKRLHQRNPNKQEMALESTEQLDDSTTEFNSSNCIDTNNENNNKIVACKQDNSRRRSLRTLRSNPNSKDKVIEKDTLNLTDRPQTPTEIINGMTSFTFSNYFTPCSKESSPLPALSWADSDEVWETMLQKDREYKRDSLYIRKHPSLQPRMRSVLLDWLVEVCEVYRLHRETFYLAVDYVDRYLSTQRNIPKTRLQLVGVTALFIAAKNEEIYPPKLTEFAYVTDGACTEEEILQQEMNLLQCLKWKLCPVTPVSWLTVYLQIANRRLNLPSKENIDENFEMPYFSAVHLCRGSELIDICCLDTGFLQFSYSIIAASALYHMVGKDLVEVTGHKHEELFPCIQWLAPFASALLQQQVKPPKHFEKIPREDSHNIQVHNNGVQILDLVHTQLSTVLPVNNLQRSSPMVQCKGLLTPPRSTEKEIL